MMKSKVGRDDGSTSVRVRFTAEELRDLDAWSVIHGGPGATRASTVKRLVERAIAIDNQWEIAKSSVADEGLRPDELTSENDG
jgi:hypothetical protein